MAPRAVCKQQSPPGRVKAAKPPGRAKAAKPPGPCECSMAPRAVSSGKYPKSNLRQQVHLHSNNPLCSNAAKFQDLFFSVTIVLGEF